MRHIAKPYLERTSVGAGVERGGERELASAHIQDVEDNIPKQ